MARVVIITAEKQYCCRLASMPCPACLQAWVRVASDEFIASRFNTSFASSQGDLGSLQAGIAAARQPRAMLAAHMAPKVQGLEGFRG